MASILTTLSRFATASFEEYFIFVLLIVFGGILVGVFWLGGWKTRLDGLPKQLETTLQVNFQEIKSKLDLIVSFSSPIRLQQSPVQLSDIGKKVAEDIYIDEWIGEYAAEFSGDLEDKNAYEIQEFCFQYAQTDFRLSVKDAPPREGLQEALEMAAYKHGLQLSHVLEVIGLVLRDKILERLNRPKE